MRLLVPFFLGLASASLKNIQYTVLENTKDCWKTCGNGYRYYGGPCEDPCGAGAMCCSHTPRGECNFKQALTIKNEEHGFNFAEIAFFVVRERNIFSKRKKSEIEP